MTTFDPLTADFAKRSHEIFAVMRAQAPVFRHDRIQFPCLSVFRYEDIRSVLLDWRTWSSEIELFREMLLGDAAIMIQDDPPKHTRYKMLVGPWLNSVQPTLADFVKKRIAKHFAIMLSGHDVEFCSQFASAVAMDVLAELLGLTEEEAGFLSAWTDRLGKNVGLEFLEFDGVGVDKQKAVVAGLHQELSAFIATLEAARRQASDSNFLSFLRTSSIEPWERTALAKSLAFAGMSTVATLLSNAVWILVQRPEALERLRAQEFSVEQLANEILRFKGTFRGVHRIATRDGMLEDVSFKKGDYLIAWITSGNWDERRFPSPSLFEPARTIQSNLAFGAGVHVCLGMQLAKLQLHGLLLYLRDTDIGIKFLDAEPSSDPWVDGFDSLHLQITGGRDGA